MLSLNSVNIITSKTLFSRSISISFLPSSITYLKGKNGSGKTSILKAIAGILKLSEGKITFGKNNTPISEFPKPYCNYIGHKTGIKPELTVFDNISFWAQKANSFETVNAAIFYFNLQEFSNIKCYELSAGLNQKVALARLLACSYAPIWLLDEVENSLDKETKQLLNNLIVSKADSGGIVIATSHSEPAIKSAIILNIEDY